MPLTHLLFVAAVIFLALSIAGFVRVQFAAESERLILFGSAGLMVVAFILLMFGLSIEGWDLPEEDWPPVVHHR